jgi:hypothetical protein
LVALLGLVVVVLPVRSAEPRFYADDPIRVDDDQALDAADVGEWEDTDIYDWVINNFGEPGERRDVRALNVNTADEVPDSSWFTNRVGRHDVPMDDLVRGPDEFDSISLDGWVVVAGKSTGLQSGFRMVDPTGQLYQVEFDPPSNPEMATGAEIVGTAFYYAFGYHTVEVYLAEFDSANVVIAPDARMFDPLIGEKRQLTNRDIDNILRRVARQPDGKYRVLASRFAPGGTLGNFRYYGTRPDDPNDIVPHEHRRELRAARVFGAWLNHDDSRGVNSLDRLIEESGRHYVRHYMFDFGSILGSGTAYPQRHRAGNEYIVEWPPGWLSLATLGLYTRPWQRIDYPQVPPAIGRLESEAFDPLKWKPEYPNPAFGNMRGDDAFWAARIVATFSDEEIRAIVEKARFTDPAATAFLTETLIVRRDKVLRTWLTAVNPLVDFALSNDGVLTFANAAADAGVAPSADSYEVRWARFDNATDTATPIDMAATVSDLTVRVPAEVGDAVAVGDYIQLEVGAFHPDFPSWARPVTVHFRRVEAGWDLVGVTRDPDPLPRSS